MYLSASNRRSISLFAGQSSDELCGTDKLLSHLPVFPAMIPSLSNLSTLASYKGCMSSPSSPLSPSFAANRPGRLYIPTMTPTDKEMSGNPSTSPCSAVPKSVSQSFMDSAENLAPSPSARARRSAPPSRTPAMQLETTVSNHTLKVKLPVEIQPEMVTVSVQKGDRLSIVADAWHMEEDSESCVIFGYT